MITANCDYRKPSYALILNDLYAEIYLSVYLHELCIKNPCCWISDALYHIKVNEDMFLHDIYTFWSWLTLCHRLGISINGDNDVDMDVYQRKLQPLTDEQKHLFDVAIKKPDSEYLINHEKFGSRIVKIRGVDFKRLLLDHKPYFGWLNDELMNAYISLLQMRNLSRCRKNPNHESVLFMGTFFFQQLAYTGFKFQFKYTYRIRQLRFEKFQERNLPFRNIFQCDKMIFPVNVGGIHWACGCINFRERTLELYDSLRYDDGFTCHAFKCMKQLLCDEWRTRVADNHVDLDWDFNFDLSDWKHVTFESIYPKQGNLADCGVFALKCADWLSDCLFPNYSQKHMEYFRKRMGVEILMKQTLDY